jgi:hypothetical protein
MKKILSLLTGTAFVLAAGLAYAEDRIYSGIGDTNNTMIHNEDLSHIQLDQDRATLNQMPAESEIEGSAAGGVSAEADGMGTEIEQGKTPADKNPAEPGAEGRSAGGTAKDSDRWQKEKDMKKEESSVDKSSEGSAAGGPGEGGVTKDSDTYQYQY